MSAGLATLGYESPAVTSGGGGGPSGIRVYFSMLASSDGTRTAGLDLSAAGVVQVSKNGAAYANRAGDAPTSIGSGDYYYELDSTESDEAGSVLLKVVKAGYAEVHTEKELGDPAQVSDVTSAVTTLTAAIVAAVGTLQGAIGSAITTINSNTDDEAAGINTHTDDQIAALQSDLETAIDAAITTINANTDTRATALTTLLLRLLGLHGENGLLDGGSGFPDAQYNDHGVMTAGRLRAWDTKADLEAATAGAADGADGETFCWHLVGTEKGSTGRDGTFARKRIT